MQFLNIGFATAALLGMSVANPISPTVTANSLNPFGFPEPSSVHSVQSTVAPPEPTKPAIVEAAAAALTEMVVHVTNQAGVDISTHHVKASAAPEGLIDGGGSGILPSAAVGKFTIKNGYHGTMFANRFDWGQQGTNTPESQVEVNFQPEKKEETDPKVTIEVSYVVGFTYPIVCFCSDGAFQSGCDINLWEYKKADGTHNKCLEENTVGSCVNPAGKPENQDDRDPFFAPCAVRRKGVYIPCRQCCKRARQVLHWNLQLHEPRQR
ncbi:hypothetical protein QBC34DRAFT_470821 [Podospora aff. communis PSN243]|uniref:Uncharacterized protein n=1 Tax=Podospora aff. communis PSN243 TaxID=3040156 RepID=A0AAV9GDY3_9PEZI|nr:hypothetical protein QBC34DRAFT_470821 [Podospora aff. communis PSN243]